MSVTPIFSSYGEFNSKRKIGPIEWPHYDLLVIHHGEVKIHFDNKTIFLASRQAVLIPPNTHFRGKSNIKSSLASVHHFHLSEGNFDEKIHIKRSLSEDFFYYLEKSLESEVNDTGEKKEALLTLILIEFLNGSEKLNSFPNQVIEFLKQKNYNCKTDELAKLTNLSTSQFRKVFNRQFKMSPAKFILRGRINLACNLMNKSPKPIKEIASELGFTEITHFYRSFKKVTNMTPREYRQLNQFSG